MHLKTNSAASRENKPRCCESSCGSRGSCLQGSAKGRISIRCLQSLARMTYRIAWVFPAGRQARTQRSDDARRTRSGFGLYRHEYIQRYIPALRQLAVSHFRRSGESLMGDSMSSDQYSLLCEACLVVARQPNTPDLQARWLALAQTSSKLAKNDSDKKSRSLKRRQN
jgi:hypothetical protein